MANNFMCLGAIFANAQPMEPFVYECVNCGHQLSGDDGASRSCPECRRLMKRIGSS
jgi:DNA-directed RNA polymerase subunit RPC12/RpoP